MTWEEIKKILQEEGGKCVIIEENGSAYYVVEKRQGRNKPKEAPAVAEATEENNHQAIERVNKDVAELKTEEDEEADFSDLEENQDVKIEDLPF